MARSRKHPGKRAAASLDAVEHARVGIYVRRSTDDERQPYSTEAQEERLRAYVDSQPGWQLTHRFSDDASGASANRPGLNEARHAAHNGTIDVLLVYRVDRFSRNLGDIVTLLEELEETGVVFRSATEPFDTSTPMGRMLVQMLGMFAQFERDTIVDRTTNGLERKVANGQWKGGRRPYGYTVDPDTHHLVPEPHEAAVVRLIFRLYTDQHLGSTAIAATLNERGHRTTNTRRWSGRSVLAVLTNHLYLGELTFRDTHAPQAHTPLITRELFDRAHQLRTHRRDHRTPTTCTPSTSDFLLSGLLHCPHCHAAMVGTRATGKTTTYRYYTCSTRARYSTEACNADRLAADALERAVLQPLTRVYRHQRHRLHDAVTTAQQQARAQQHHLRAEHDTVTTERARTDQALQRHLTAFEHGELDTTVLSRRVDELTRTHRQLASREQELTTQLTEPTHPDEATLEAITEQLNTVLATGPQAEAKAVLAKLIATVRVTGPQHVVPVFRIPADDAAPAASTQDTASPAGVRTVPHQRRRTGIEPA
ncbi:recombinase family protein [Salinifilum ghardaiensis]